MAYKNGTYIAFHANGTTEPAKSDIKYFNLLKAWHEHEDIEFRFINGHEKTSAVRDTSKRSTLERSLKTRINSSKNMLLIVGSTTKEDDDWVPMEIRYAIDECKIPVIVTYPDYEIITKSKTIMPWATSLRLTEPEDLSHLWPTALSYRIKNGTARVIHIPFKKDAIKAAISQYAIESPPKSALSYYSYKTYTDWGLL